MGRVEKSIVIKASPEKAWELLALDRWSEWQVGSGFTSLPTKGMKFTSEVNVPEDKYRVGASAQPDYTKINYKVTESLKNEKITYLIEETGRNSNTTLVLESAGKGTKLTYAVSYEMPWGVLGKLLEKLLKRTGERQLEKSLEKLKSILEK